MEATKQTAAVLFPFKLRVFDKHESQKFDPERNEWVPEPLQNDDEWHRFDFYFDLNNVRIKTFKEYVLFDKDDNPTSCIKVEFTDSAYVYACYSMSKFLEIYNGEYAKLYREYTESFGPLNLQDDIKVAE